MAGLTSVSADSLTKCTAAFGVQVKPETVQAPSWAVTAPAGAQPVDVVLVEVQPGGLLATLYVATQLTPNKTYNFAITGGKSVGNADLNPASQNCAVGAITPKLSSEWPHGGLDALTQTLGEEIQQFCGAPMTKLLVNLAFDATVAFVESTLGFASKGAIFISNRRYTYTSKTDCAFHGLSYTVNDGQVLPQGSEVLCDARAIFPD